MRRRPQPQTIARGTQSHRHDWLHGRRPLEIGDDLIGLFAGRILSDHDKAFDRRGGIARELDGLVIEKSIVVPSRQNIVHSTFRSLGDGRRVRLRVRPLIDFRPLETPVGEALSSGYTLTIRGDRYEVSAGGRICRLCGWRWRAPK